MPAPELVYQTGIDQVITNVVRRGAFKAIETQTRIDTFITIAAEQFGEDDLSAAIVGGTSTTVVAAEIDSIRRLLARALKDAVIETAQTGREARQEAEGQDALFEWQTNSGNPCPDCRDRSGQVHSLEYWNAVGTPRTGVTICGSRCKCILNQVKK